MGQKTNPKGFRLILTKNWASKWYANKKVYAQHLHEDIMIRKFLRKLTPDQGTCDFIIRRMSDKLEVVIQTSRPGLIIGKKGAEIDNLKKKLKNLVGREVWLEVEEIKRPDVNAVLVGQNIANQLQRRAAWRRVLKKTMQSSLEAGALGIKVQLSGRIAGAEIARTEWYKEGKVPLHTMRCNIDYGVARAETTYGSIGIKVWINRGDR